MPDSFLRTPPREIAIVMLSALGDAVHVLPVVNALKRKWPESRITWVIQPVPHQLVADHPAVDEFVLFHRRRGSEAVRSYVDLRRALDGKRFDLLINLQVYMKAGLITALMDAEVKLGFDRKRARDMNWLFTNRRIAARPPGHVQDQYFEFLQHLGIDPQPVEWRIDLSDEERAAQREFQEQHGPYCAIVVGTSKTAKNWFPDRFARVVEAVQREHGLTPVLVGGPSAVERELAEAIIAQSAVKPINTLSDSVRRLTWLLDGSALVVSADTGPLHLARALDRPVVGLYGYTNPKRYGPYRKYADLVVDGYARFPGEAYEPSPVHRPEGMQRVQVDAVLEKIAYAMERYVAVRGTTPSP